MDQGDLEELEPKEVKWDDIVPPEPIDEVSEEDEKIASQPVSRKSTPKSK